MKYIVKFYGCPKGRLNTAMKERVAKLVEAESVEDAELKPYDTHDHLLPSQTRVSRAISTGELSYIEIKAADAADALYVTEDGLGWVDESWLQRWRLRLEEEKERG
jgi:hypothetical protein